MKTISKPWPILTKDPRERSWVAISKKRSRGFNQTPVLTRSPEDFTNKWVGEEGGSCGLLGKVEHVKRSMPSLKETKIYTRITISLNSAVFMRDIEYIIQSIVKATRKK